MMEGGFGSELFGGIRLHSIRIYHLSFVFMIILSLLYIKLVLCISYSLYTNLLRGCVKVKVLVIIPSNLLYNIKSIIIIKYLRCFYYKFITR